MTTFTCIIPAYNEEHTLPQTITVLLPLLGKQLAQLIIINDASTDQTATQLHHFASHKHLQIIHNPHNL
ncbi:MAG: glycosyltransferase [bacterium]|nr:glycosyltransferase [bacterium]